MGEGFSTWTDVPGLFDNAWLDGAFLTDLPGTISSDEGNGVILRKALDGSHVILRPYRNASAPDADGGKSWTIPWQAVVEADWLRFRAAARKATWVYWSTGERVTDVFTATSGDTKKLTRPLATGVVTGVTTSTHPTRVYLDGSLDAGAASVSGQTVTVNSTGTIRIEYTPVFRVVLVGWGESYQEFNNLIANPQILEVVSFS